MHTLIGIDADLSRGCGTGIPIIQRGNTCDEWCWWHRERKLQTWFPKHQLAQEVPKHKLHLLEDPVPFNPIKSSIALFASANILDFNRVILPVRMNQEYCQWGCLTSVRPLILVTYTLPSCASQWLDDLARITVHSIDRNLLHSNGTSIKKETLRVMTDIALRIARDPSIILNLHVRICTNMIKNEEVNQYFCNHVAGKCENVNAWRFEKMLHAYSLTIQEKGHLLHQ